MSDEMERQYYANEQWHTTTANEDARPMSPATATREQLIKDYVRQARERISAGQPPQPYMKTRPPSGTIDQNTIGAATLPSIQTQWPLADTKPSPLERKPVAGNYSHVPTRRPLNSQPSSPSSATTPTSQSSFSSRPDDRKRPPQQPSHMRPPQPTLQQQQKHQHQHQQQHRGGRDVRQDWGQRRQYNPMPQGYMRPPPQQRIRFPPSSPTVVPPRILEESESGQSARSTVASQDSYGQRGAVNFLIEDTTDDDGSLRDETAAQARYAASSKHSVSPSVSQWGSQRSNRSDAVSSVTSSEPRPPLPPAAVHLAQEVKAPLKPTHAHPDLYDEKLPVELHAQSVDDSDSSSDGDRASTANLLAVPATVHHAPGRAISPGLQTVSEDETTLHPPRPSLLGIKRLSKASNSSGRLSPRPHASNSQLQSSTSAENTLLSRFNTQASSNPRESTTSLQGVIRRALKLATNLENGKTASRFGMDWMAAQNGSQPPHQRPILDEKHHSENSLGSMIDRFPSPQPVHAAHDPARNYSAWPVENSESKRAMHRVDAAKFKHPRKRRMCCGMPFWIFIVVTVLVVCLIAAAVVIPVALVVIPNQARSNNAASSSSAQPSSTSVPSAGTCATQLPCANGGTSVLSASQTCQCLCANGFFGQSCTQKNDAQCVTQDYGSAQNATIGSAIPSLISTAQGTYSIALSGQSLLSLFASANLSCTLENQLVTLAGSSSSRRSVVNDLQSRDSLFVDDAIAKRAPVVLNFDPMSATSLTFSRIAILYVFQVSQSLNKAVQAQSNLQAYISNPQTAGTALDLGSSWTVNLARRQITGPDGKVVGSS